LILGGQLDPRETPLYRKHVDLGGRMVSFAGFLMPMQFSGIVEEHRAVRSTVGIFDVSHMGEISVSGRGALAYVNRLTTNDASALDLCQAQYTAMLNEGGGVIDDLLVYRRKFDYLLVVNAANTARDLAWIQQHAPGGVRVEDQSEATGQIALQGPMAASAMSPVCDSNVADLAYFRSMKAEIAGVTCLVSRTGYTGEDGYEIYMDASHAGRVWDALMASEPAPAPCGLGARDTLRLEMAFRLHGSDMDETTTPLEAGLGWVVKLEKGDFFGREVLLRQTEEGLQRRLIGLKTESKRFPRRGCAVVADDRRVGQVTSGGFAPSLGCGIALAYIEADTARRSTEFRIDVRGELVPAAFVKGPFYKRPRHMQKGEA
jgi:aminomethyltransferase